MYWKLGWKIELRSGRRFLTAENAEVAKYLKTLAHTSHEALAEHFTRARYTAPTAASLLNDATAY